MRRPTGHPGARDRLREFQWFCLDHIREFNRGWDYLRRHEPGRDRAASAGRRDLAPPDLALRHRARHRPALARRVRPVRRGGGTVEQRGRHRPRTKAERDDGGLGLEAGFTLAELKRRYKTLAKKHHPDLHGGDKAAEERLKLINEAYTYLRQEQVYA